MEIIESKKKNSFRFAITNIEGVHKLFVRTFTGKTFF